MTQADNDLRDRLRRALPVAMKARDRTAITALRSALAAIDNAEAFDPDDALAEGMYGVIEPAGWEPADPDDAAVDPADPGQAAQPGLAGPPPFAGTVSGVGVAEVARRGLTPKQVEGIVRAEIETLEVAADVLEAAGKHEHAEQVRAQRRVLLAHVDRA
ncbi:MAG TPA: hypothetical protein VFN05_03225 [Actinomycetes bacterium]|nr:hypothetical protein [Actinomycetes bacterium]